MIDQNFINEELLAKQQDIDIEDLSDSDEKEQKTNVIVDSVESIHINDPLKNLPENWAQLDFERKKSCILSHIYSTSVNKAISHLEALQNAIDDWMLRAVIDRQQSSKTGSSCLRRVTDLVRTRSNSTPVKKMELKFVLTPIVHSFEDGSKLEIRGTGGKSDNKALDMVIQKRPEPYDNLKADGVLEEVLIILARLEYDRRNTEAALIKERENVIILKDRIEKWALKRITELPIMVQKEHEACVTDITELHWHIAFNIKSENRLKHKVEVEEKFCAQLQEDIENINKSTPLIEEKISLELKAIQKILQAQQETDELLMKSRERYNDASEKNKVAHSKANKEIEALNADLADCRRELNKAKKRLLEANETSSNLLKTLEQSNKDLSENIRQENYEVERREKNREKNVRFSKEFSRIENDRFKIKKDTDIIIYDNEGLHNKIVLMTKQYEEELTQLKDILYKKENKLEKINKKIREKEINIEEMERDKANIVFNIQKEEKNKERLAKDKEKNEQQLVAINENYSRAVQINDTVVNDIQKEKKRYEQREENLRRQIAEIKKQLFDEKHQLSVLTSRLQNEVEEFQNSIVDARVKKQQFETRKVDLESRLKELEKQVNDIETRRNAVDKRIDLLKNDISKINNLNQTFENESNKKIKELEPIKSAKTKEYQEKNSKLENMKTHTADMQKKIEVMAESKAVMDKTIEKANEEIDDLNEIFNEISIQCNSTGYLDKNLQDAIEGINERDKKNEIEHIEHVKERHGYLLDLENNVKKSLEENKELASKYRQLKYDMYMKKLQYLLKIERGIEVFSKVKDKRQLHLLQIRMHNALEDYFNFQVEHGKNNFSKLNTETSKNNEKLFALEDLYHDSVERITSFLKNQMDFSLVRQQAMQKVQREEIEEQNKINNQNRSSSLNDTPTTNTKSTKPKVNFKIENTVH